MPFVTPRVPDRFADAIQIVVRHETPWYPSLCEIRRDTTRPGRRGGRPGRGRMPILSSDGHAHCRVGRSSHASSQLRASGAVQPNAVTPGARRGEALDGLPKFNLFDGVAHPSAAAILLIHVECATKASGQAEPLSAISTDLTDEKECISTDRAEIPPAMSPSAAPQRTCPARVERHRPSLRNASSRAPTRVPSGRRRQGPLCRSEGTELIVCRADIACSKAVMARLIGQPHRGHHRHWRRSPVLARENVASPVVRGSRCFTFTSRRSMECARS